MAAPTTVIVNLSRFALEPHVRKALRTAWSLSNGSPLNGGHLLKSAIEHGAEERSEAFEKIAELLPLTHKTARVDIAPPDFAALPLTKPLADSFSVAEGFLGDKKSMWGRDYVTLALLAKDDPSVVDVVSVAGVSLESVRGEWFRFVCATDRRRPPEAWARWWEGAGLAVPIEGKSAPTASRAFLLTWDPARYQFANPETYANKIKGGGPVEFTWSTGGRTDLPRGGQVFLVRQGAEPRGLVGVGEVTGDVHEAPHWDPKERKQGKTSSIVKVQWKAFSPAPFVELSRLIQETGNPMWSLPSSGIEITGTTRQRLDDLWPRAWSRYVHDLPNDAVINIEPRQWIARFTADTSAAADDSLKIDRYVNAFARVIVSQALTPPLSIGLFGDWGSGKSFFMDRLHTRIEELVKEQRTDSFYWPKICQIRFNAWHYTETNLWASLVSTLFNCLSEFLDGKKDDGDEFNQLLNNLELAGELRKEAQEKLTASEAKHEAAFKKLSLVERELAALPEPPPPSADAIRKALSKNVSQMSDHATIITLLKSAADWSGRDHFKEAAAKLEEGDATVKSVRDLLTEAELISSKAGFWWRILSGAELYKTWGFWVVIAVIVSIALVGLAIVKWQLASEALVQTWTMLGEVLVAVGAIAGWIRSRMAGAGAVFDRLGTFQAEITRDLEEAREEDRIASEAARDQALRKEKEAKAAVALAQRELEQSAEVERKAREAVRESTSQARLARFIRERTSNADYEKHLGLIAMIHRDFRRLSDLMMRAQKEGPQDSVPQIDRIILYIDDLDRCYPPDRVVRVLEAVHLLLFFPLFVVVVGVDSRWVSRALYKHYDGMLGDEFMAAMSKNGGEIERAPAESHDFLEKIFQVPFWLRRMEPSAVQRMLHGLISADEIEKADAIAGATPNPAPTAAPLNPAVPNVPLNAPAGAQVPASNQPGEGGENPTRAAAKRATAEAEIDDDVLAAPMESLRITEAELRFMDDVAPLMPRTPRSVKRFVNIYRLYKAALSPQALARFLGTPDRAGNYQAVQILLALVTGTPRFAQRVFDGLHRPGDEAARTLSNLVTSLDLDDDGAKTTLDALREFARGPNDVPLTTLREVSPLVSRYSVHHMVSGAPGDAGLG